MIFSRSLLLISLLHISVAQEDSARVAAQNPSPMIETTRAHERIPQQACDGIGFEIAALFTRPVQAFIPARSTEAPEFDLLIHFHGAPYLAHFAATQFRGDLIAAALHLGPGSKVYYDAFSDPARFPALIDSIHSGVRSSLKREVRTRRVILSGFSAGYGAIRKILGTEEGYRLTAAVLLLDGLHASYVPDGKTLFEGGALDTVAFASFLKLARDASSETGTKRFLITHSEIFPGTFVSTTEASDYLLAALGMKRTPILKWGPLGMQQLSIARRSQFAVLGFAGNTAPDHIDHLHGLSWFLNELMELTD